MVPHTGHGAASLGFAPRFFLPRPKFPRYGAALRVPTHMLPRSMGAAHHVAASTCTAARFTMVPHSACHAHVAARQIGVTVATRYGAAFHAAAYRAASACCRAVSVSPRFLGPRLCAAAHFYVPPRMAHEPWWEKKSWKLLLKTPQSVPNNF